MADDLVKALGLLLHMIVVLGEGNRPSAHDIAEARELITQIKRR